MERRYRLAMRPPDLVSFRVSIGETDLWVAASSDLSTLTSARVRYYRRELRSYMARDPGFAAAMLPRPAMPEAPTLVLRMLKAGASAGVGPMAAVAGAIAQAVAEDLKFYSKELILENGGDLYLVSDKARTVAIFAGESEFSGRLGIALPPCPRGIGVCTSSGTIGPSYSEGRADAAVVTAGDAALADAAATALGNRIGEPGSVEAAVNWAAALPGVRGALAVMAHRMAAAGDLELVPLTTEERPATVRNAD